LDGGTSGIRTSFCSAESLEAQPKREIAGTENSKIAIDAVMTVQRLCNFSNLKFILPICGWWARQLKDLTKTLTDRGAIS